jgi:hypothetical protein
MSSKLSRLSVEQLKRAIVIKEQIEKLGKELLSIPGENPKAASIADLIVSQKKRTMIAAQRAKLSAAQKARHATQRTATAPEKGNAAMSKRKGR